MSFEFLETLRHDGRVRDPQTTLTPLKGGVSSDIYLVQDGANLFVVKRALAKLRVKDHWIADVSRNANEEAYLRHVSRFMPEAVPQLLFANPRAGYFAMEYLGESFESWKDLLLAGKCVSSHAARAGEILGTIHQKTAGHAGTWKRFDTTDGFHQLRTEPYLLTTGSRHADLDALFQEEAKRLEATRECLVHGDFSPKNILIKDRRMVLLDCEVAWYGDPAFDVAFLLNHFFLKALYHAPRDPGFIYLIKEFWHAYHLERSALNPDWETRVTRLLLMLMLARIDGKSPVEYLDSTRKDFVRSFVHRNLLDGDVQMAALATDWLGRIRNIAVIQ
jgi:aminoglycoside phosphotransferase (APT) family kinase protein